MAMATSAAMAPNCTPSLPALAQKAVQDTPLFTEALMSGQGELLSFSENQSSSPLLSLQQQAQLLCRDDDAYARFQEKPPSFTFVDDLEVQISDEEIERLAPLFCDEEIEVLCTTPQASVQPSWPRSDDQTGKKRMTSPPWPSCIADDDDEDEEEAGPPPSSPPPTPTKKARTETKSRSWRERHEPPLASPPFPPPIKKARTHTNRRSRPEHVAARLRKWHNTMATRILTRQFRATELSRGRTALRCQCSELALRCQRSDDAPRVFGCCALDQDAPPEHRAWMHYSAQGHAPPLVGGPGVVLVPAASAGSSKWMLRQYMRWRRSVSLPTRFYVQCAVEKGLARQPDDDAMVLCSVVLPPDGM